MRIFIAVCLTKAWKDSAVSGMEELHRQGVRGTFTRPDNLHLTLAFIGETSHLKEIQAAVQEVSVSPFEISPGKLGRFRDILWLGITGEQEMQRLARALRQSLTAHGIAYDEKPFKAYITLVHRTCGTELPKVDIPPVRMTVSHISVMKSERVNGELIYTEL